MKIITLLLAALLFSAGCSETDKSMSYSDASALVNDRQAERDQWSEDISRLKSIGVETPEDEERLRECYKILGWKIRDLRIAEDYKKMVSQGTTQSFGDYEKAELEASDRVDAMLEKSEKDDLEKANGK